MSAVSCAKVLILWALWHGSFLNQVPLALILVSLLNGRTHVKELLVAHVVVQQREHAMEPVHVVFVELPDIEGTLNLIWQLVELLNVSKQASLIEAWDVLELQEAKSGHLLIDLSSDFVLRALHVDSR